MNTKKTVNVLVTSVGSEPGMGVIKGLRLSKSPKVKIIGVDCDKIAIGFALCDYSYRVPRAGSRNFISRILEIAALHNVSVVFPILEDELLVFHEARTQFARKDIKLIINNKKTLTICFDKELLYKTCLEEKIPVPKTYNLNELKSGMFDFPMVLKRKAGRRIEDVTIARNENEIRAAIESKDYELIGQQYISGREFTAEVLCDNYGKKVVVVSRERLQVKSGVCVKAKFENRTGINPIVERILSVFQVFGPLNIQFIEDNNGNLFVIDINPKFPGGGGLTLAAGVNIPLYLLKMALGIKYFPKQINYSDGKVIGRYYKEVTLKPEKIIEKTKRD